jgi:hypothetical protein
VSDKDEHWLINKANFVEKDVVVDLLEKASDYKHRLKHLNLQQKILVEKLEKLGESMKKVAGSKRKPIYISMGSHLQFPSTYNSYQLFYFLRHLDVK